MDALSNDTEYIKVMASNPQRRKLERIQRYKLQQAKRYQKDKNKIGGIVKGNETKITEDELRGRHLEQIKKFKKRKKNFVLQQTITELLQEKRMFTA